MAMTKDDWQKFEDALKGVFGSATLKIDNDEITFQKALHKNTLVLSVYVNGAMKGEWFTRDDENSCKELNYFCQREAFVYDLKFRKAVKKESKRFVKKYYPKIDDKRFYFWVCFASAAQVKSQYKKRFGDKNITLIKATGL